MTRPFAFIIEDDPQLNRIFSIALQNDFDTEACSDGLAALDRLAHIVPDLIILDLNLTGASGQEILASVRADERLAQTRVILATADHQRASYLEGHAELVLLKPISPFQLRELAVRLCRKGAL